MCSVCFYSESRGESVHVSLNCTDDHKRACKFDENQRIDCRYDSCNIWLWESISSIELYTNCLSFDWIWFSQTEKNLQPCIKKWDTKLCPTLRFDVMSLQWIVYLRRIIIKCSCLAVILYTTYKCYGCSSQVVRYAIYWNWHHI